MRSKWNILSWESSVARYRKIPVKSFSEPVCSRIKCFDAGSVCLNYTGIFLRHPTHAHPYPPKEKMYRWHDPLNNSPDAVCLPTVYLFDAVVFRAKCPLTGLLIFSIWKNWIPIMWKRQCQSTVS